MFNRTLFEILHRHETWSRGRCFDRKRSNCRLHGLEALEDRRLLTFNPAVDYNVGTNPQAIVTGDFNGDSRPDVATANSTPNTLSILLSNANGTLQPAINFTTGTSPRSMAVGDFNADGKLDIVTANVGDVSVLLGNGNGTFQASSQLGFSDGSSPSSVAVGDFNGDGKLDLGVTTNVYYPGYSGYYSWSPPSYFGRANILLGNGAGSFTAPAATGGYGFFNSAVLADFSGDGKDDFALVAMETNSYLGGTVQLLMGTAAGVPGSPSYLSTSHTNYAVAAGDANNDGKIDLLTLNVNTLQSTTSVGVHLGTGTGTFAAPQLYDAGRYGASIKVGDFNGDNKSDILTTNPDHAAVSVLLGTGTGVFRPSINAATAASPYSVAVADFNGDGRTDAASANSGSNNVSVLLNDGSWVSLDAPLLTISDLTINEGNVGNTAATFTVSLSSASSQNVTVNYTSTDAVAIAGSDYQSEAGTVTFTPGQTSKTISIAIIGDRTGETNEGFRVLLTSATNVFISDGIAEGMILDDEPFVSLAGDVTVIKGRIRATTPLVFTVLLSTAYDVPVTVDYYTSDVTDEWIYYSGYVRPIAGTDYQISRGTLTFAAGQTSQSITVPVNADRVGEMWEYFLIDIRNPGNAKVSNLSAFGSIADDDPMIRLAGGSVVEGNSGTKTLPFTASLSAPSDVPVTVAFGTWNSSAVAGSDYVATSGTVTFAAGQTIATIPVTIKGDLTVESDEYVSMYLSNPINAGIDVDWANGAILDDDTPPSITIYSDGDISEGNSGTKLMTFTVAMSQVSSKTVQVNYATANGTAKTSDNDYTAKSGTLFFAPGEQSKTISIVIKGDTKRENDEYFYVKLSRPVNSTISTTQAVGSIWNDDGLSATRSRTSYASTVDLAIEELAVERLKKRSR